MNAQTTDILARLAEDARRLRVARKLPDGKLSMEWIIRVRDDFRAFLENYGLSQSIAARKLGEGFSPGVISQFLNMTAEQDFVGDIDRVSRGINQFMETHARRSEVPRPGGWVETEVARRMLNLISKTIELRAIGLIYSDAGRGKTMTLEAAAGLFPGAVLVRVLSGTTKAGGFASLLAHTLRLRCGKRTLDIQLALIDKFKGTDRPILVDEAHQLSRGALEFLRDLHDSCEIPIVLAGTKKIDDATSDIDEFFGQFSSRVALRYDVTEQLRGSLGGGSGGGGGGGGKLGKALHSIEEIRRIFESDKLRLTDDGRMAVARLANMEGMGGLRLCKQVLLVAVATAQGQPIDSKLVIKVLRGMHGEDIACGRYERRMADLKVRIA